VDDRGLPSRHVENRPVSVGIHARRWLGAAVAAAYERDHFRRTRARRAQQPNQS
jgi:hypothetical protein